MSVRVLRSPADAQNPEVVERRRTGREANATWLRRIVGDGLVPTGPDWSLLLLIGGNDPLSFRLRVAQSHVRHDLSPSAWSHVAFLPALGDDLAASATIEVSLAPAQRFGPFGFVPPTNGLQRGRLGAYLDAKIFPNIALLSVPVASDATVSSLDALRMQRSAVDGKAIRGAYSATHDLVPEATFGTPPPAITEHRQ
jgi:hypothetical protein